MNIDDAIKIIEKEVDIINLLHSRCDAFLRLDISEDVFDKLVKYCNDKYYCNFNTVQINDSTLKFFVHNN